MYTKVPSLFNVHDKNASEVQVIFPTNTVLLTGIVIWKVVMFCCVKFVNCRKPPPFALALNAKLVVNTGFVRLPG